MTTKVLHLYHGIYYGITMVLVKKQSIFMVPFTEKKSKKSFETNISPLKYTHSHFFVYLNRLYIKIPFQDAEF